MKQDIPEQIRKLFWVSEWRSQGGRNRRNTVNSKTRLKWNHFKRRHAKKEMSAEQSYERSSQYCTGELDGCLSECFYTNTCRMGNKQEELCSFYTWSFSGLDWLKPWTCWTEFGVILLPAKDCARDLLRLLLIRLIWWLMFRPFIILKRWKNNFDGHLRLQWFHQKQCFIIDE